MRRSPSWSNNRLAVLLAGCLVGAGTIACSDSGGQGTLKHDAAPVDSRLFPVEARDSTAAGPDVADDAGDAADLALPDLARKPEVADGQALPPETAADGGVATIDVPPVSPDLDGGGTFRPDVGSLDGGMCYWQVQGARYSLKHFKFNLVTPEGPASFKYPSGYGYDAGLPSTNDFEGRIVSKSGNQFTVDTCQASATCQPSLYQFTLCDSSSCQSQASPAGIELSVPLGRRVRVVWHLEMDVPSFSPGLYWLAVYDAEAGATKGTILFLGSGGRNPNQSSGMPNYFNDLPFSVAAKALSCGGTTRDASLHAGDDYAFVFTPKPDDGRSLQLGTGESGTFEFDSTAGTQQLKVHCLMALQSGYTDDYWNWEFWAENPAALVTPLDAGTH